jgi:hypothetical protein
MSISALPIRGDHLQVSFSIPCKRSTCVASSSSNFVTGVSNICPAFALWSSQLYLNDRRAKRKHDFPSRADECQLNAQKAIRTADREAWLKLAADWRKLAESAELNPMLDTRRH